MATGTAGRLSRWNCNGTNLRGQRMTAKESASPVDTTNFESATVASGGTTGPAKESTIGPPGVSWSGTCVWNANDNPLATPGIYPRDDLPNSMLYALRTSTPLFSIPISTVHSGGIESVAMQEVTYSMEAESSGTYTRNG